MQLIQHNTMSLPQNLMQVYGKKLIHFIQTGKRFLCLKHTGALTHIANARSGLPSQPGRGNFTSSCVFPPTSRSRGLLQSGLKGQACYVTTSSSLSAIQLWLVLPQDWFRYSQLSPLLCLSPAVTLAEPLQTTVCHSMKTIDAALHWQVRL